MSSPRSGFRRTAAASCALAGLGVAGVAGASTLAYHDTVKPKVVQTPVAAAEQLPAEPAVSIQPAVPAVVPQVTREEVPAPQVAPAPTTAAAPAQTYAPAPAAAPKYTQTYEPAPAPAQTYTPAPASAPTQAYVPSAAGVQSGPVGTSPVTKSTAGSSSSSYAGGGSSNSSSSTTKRGSIGSATGNSGPNKSVPHTTAKGS